MRAGIVVAGLVLGIALVLGLQYWYSRPDETPAAVESEAVEPASDVPAEPEVLPEQPAEAVEPAAVPPQPERPLPPLAASDAYVAEEFAALDLPPVWLQRDALAPRAAAVLTSLADGGLPRRQLAFLVPSQAFPVQAEGERYFLDPAGYARYEPMVTALTSVPPAAMAATLKRTAPLCDAAMAELGERRVCLDEFREALRQLEAFAPVQGDIELVRPNVLFEFADPELEALPSAQKQLIRLGPDNVERLKRYARELQIALEGS